MLKKFAVITMMAALGIFAAGCTNEQQLDMAQDDLQDQQAETVETIQEAQDDGLVTENEQEAIVEQQGDTIEAAGEVAEQTGELIEDEVE